MRPRLFVWYAASVLLLVASQHACAQNGAPAMSSGRSIPGQTPPAVAAPLPSLRDDRVNNSFPREGFSRGELPRGDRLNSDPAWTHASPAAGAVPDSAVFPADELAQPVRGQSEPFSHVMQAQFTSPEPAAATSPKGLNEATNAAPQSGMALGNGGLSNSSFGNVSFGSSSSNSAATAEPRALKPRSTATGAAPEKRSSGTAQMIVSVGSSLLIVIGLLLGAAWCYRKASPNAAGNLPKQVVQVLGRTPLAPRQQLILLRFGPKLVLVSNLQGEVRMVSEIDDPLEVDRVAGLCESSQPGSISDSFRSVLHNIGRNG